MFIGILIVCAGLRSERAWAWGKDGHRIVCGIAWDEMRPTTRDRVKRLLDVVDREAFAETCNWADEHRNHGHRQTAPWHFVNVPPYATKVELARDCAKPKSCVVAQITEHEGVLRSNAPDDQKAMALKFLAHFVGDVHQPLHVSHAEDRGGNAIKLRFMRRKSDLHAVWDVEMLRETRKSWQQIARELEREITDKQRREWIGSDPLAWADESLVITKAPDTGYTDHDDGAHLGEEYQHRALPVVYLRLSQAGIRLGYLLNGIFQSER